MNWYVYCWNNPLVFVDLLGLEVIGFDVTGTGPGENKTPDTQPQPIKNLIAKANTKKIKPVVVNLPRKYISPLDAMIFAPIDTLLQLTRPVTEPLMDINPITRTARNLAAAAEGYDIYDGVITDAERVEKIIDTLGPLADIATDIVISEFFNPADVIDIFVGSYENLKGNLPEGFQANHLNQDAAFRDIIPKNEGTAVGMIGDAFSDIGSQHYEFHKSLESFWEQYRTGSLKGARPIIAEYNKALKKALFTAGFDSNKVKQLVDEAIKNQLEYGLEDDMPIPRIPGRINQKKDE